MSNCVNCDKEIIQKGNRTKVYCSDKCRMAYKRTKKVVENEQKPEPNTELPKTNTESEQTVSEKVCAGCGVRVHPLVCICADCLKAGKTHASLGLTCHKEEFSNMDENVAEAERANRILETNTLTELKKKGIWIPNWRRTQGENPGKAPTLG